MSKYRCPACGATHKEPVSQCRLCGQMLNPDFVPAEAPQAAGVGTSKGGVKGIVFIGIGVCVAVVAVALVFGLVAGNKQLDKAKDKVLPGSLNDGWTQLEDADGPITVNLPGERTQTSSAFPGTTDGKIKVWSAKVSNDTIITVGYGTVTPPAPTPPDSTLSAAAQQNYLKDLNTQWATAQGGAMTGSGQQTFVSGYPAYVIKGQQREFKVNGNEGYANQALILKGNRLIVVTVLSIYKDAEQFDRVLNSLQVG